MDPLELAPPREIPGPSTPTLAHAPLPGQFASPSTVADITKVQASRLEQATAAAALASMTPLSSSQMPPFNRTKTRTPTPTRSYLSSPPPTAEQPCGRSRSTNGQKPTQTADQIDSATPEELRRIVRELLPALQDARTSAAHHKLQHRMHALESTEAIQRMAVEMDMAHRENEVLHVAEQQRVAAPSVLTPAEPDPNYKQVHVEIYNTLLRDMEELKASNLTLERELARVKDMVCEQEGEITSLHDRIFLLRERIRANYNLRRTNGLYDDTSRSEFGTPYQVLSNPLRREQPFAALLQATDLMSQDTVAVPVTPRRRVEKKGHTRGAYSVSSVPCTPNRSRTRPTTGIYETPQYPYAHRKAPQSAPVARRSSLRDPGAQSDATVSASENESEAETELAEEDPEEVAPVSSASTLASVMLRQPVGKKRAMLTPMTQSKLFGQIRKPDVDRSEREKEPVVKRRRPNQTVGLGIACLRD
ncbi:hypothetical protein LTR50_000209 [Elasticomyces elasticus]|nr:hypothetical protein LTR50_000209 [Elasticomyces elasticus]